MDPHPTHGQGVGSNQTKHHQHLTALGPQPCSTHIPSGPPCWGPLHRLALIIDWTVQTLLHSASCAVCRCRCLFLGIPRSSRCGQAAAVGWDASDHWNREDGLPTLTEVAPPAGHDTPSQDRPPPRITGIGRMASQPSPRSLPRPGTTRPARIAALGSSESQKGAMPPLKPRPRGVVSRARCF